ncbi:MAG: Fic family protein [Fibromonadaceae bacterium]|jgi:Fic family protein|nr:Fic family protein [Fibromonadaceae bacterium]
MTGRMWVVERLLSEPQLMRNNAMEYISTKQAADKWGISQRRVRTLCEQGKIAGVIRAGKSFSIPADAKKPTDGRFRELSLAEIYEKIEVKKQELNKCRPFTKGELERLNEDFMIEYTYNSNAIEGNTLTLRETALVLRGMTIDKKPLREHLEATQHRDAFYHVCDLVSKKVPLTEKTIKDIHSIILNDRPTDRGVYRNMPVRISGSTHIPPNYVKIPELMKDLISWYGKTKPTVKQIAELHIRFECIHPFIDGNGRIGRLLANLELMKIGYPPVDIKYADRKEYYDSLNEFDLIGKTDRFEYMFATYVLERIEDYCKIL